MQLREPGSIQARLHVKRTIHCYTPTPGWQGLEALAWTVIEKLGIKF